MGKEGHIGVVKSAQKPIQPINDAGDYSDSDMVSIHSHLAMAVPKQQYHIKASIGVGQTRRNSENPHTEVKMKLGEDKLGLEYNPDLLKSN